LVLASQFKDLDSQSEDEDITNDEMSNCTRTERLTKEEPYKVMMMMSDQDKEF